MARSIKRALFLGRAHPIAENLIMTKLHTLFRQMSNLFGIIAVLCLLFLMLGTTLDITVRAITGRSISGVFEMAETSMVLLVFLGLGWTKLDNAHIRVTMLVERAPHKLQILLEVIAWSMAALMLLILASASTQDAIHSFSIREFRWGHVQFPIWWAKIALAIGLWFASLQMLFKALCIAITREPPKYNSLEDSISASQQ